MKKIIILSPALPESLKGNGVTALRYKRIFESLGFEVDISTDFIDEAYDVVLAIHAVKSHANFLKYHEQYPEIKKILVFGGTDVYEKRFREDDRFETSVDIADILLGREVNVGNTLSEKSRKKLRIIPKSVDGIEVAPKHDREAGLLKLIMVGHIRPGKNHFFVVDAIKQLPLDLQRKIQVIHIGRALSDASREKAQAYSESCDFYDWRGLISHAEALDLLAVQDAMIQPSYYDSASGSVVETIMMGKPILASGIEGVVPILGDDYDGFFDPYDLDSLGRLLRKSLNDASYLECLREQVLARRPLYLREREADSWKSVFGDLLG